MFIECWSPSSSGGEVLIVAVSSGYFGFEMSNRIVPASQYEP